MIQAATPKGSKLDPRRRKLLTVFGSWHSQCPYRTLEVAVSPSERRPKPPMKEFYKRVLISMLDCAKTGARISACQCLQAHGPR